MRGIPSDCAPADAHQDNAARGTSNVAQEAPDARYTRLARGAPATRLQEVPVSMIRGFVLVETEVGRTKAVADEIRESDLPSGGGRIISVDTVTGPYDIIVQVEAPDLDSLGKHTTNRIAMTPGVQRTITCLAVNLD